MIRLTLLVLVYLAAFGPGQQVRAQEPTNPSPASPNATKSDREQDGLKGPVRRVRSETAELTTKAGDPVEGERIVRRITTYDIQGRRIDTVIPPGTDTTPRGKEQYRHDDKGNIIEMTLRGDDGSILGKEVYQYEFDELENWKKMTTAMVMYEGGKLVLEPTEVTYRTITYFYNQALEKREKAAAAVASRPTTNPPSVVSATPTKQDAAISESKARTEPAAAEIVSNSANGEAAKSGLERNPKIEIKATKTSVPPEAPVTPSAPPEKEAVKRVSEEILRSAAVNLPRPEYPRSAELAGMAGKVEVEVIVDENGEVISAKSTSGDERLTEAAEAAARLARFAPFRLSLNRAKVLGVLTYEFTPPSPRVPVTTPAAPTAKPDESSKRASSNVEPTAVPPSLAPSEDASSSSSSSYRQGLSFLRAGRDAEAVEALKKAVYLNPQDSQAYAKLGLAYSALGKHTEAIAVFKMAADIKREVLDAEANYRLGEAYTAIGKHSEALKAFKQALYVKRAETIDGSPGSGFPESADLHFSLGLAHYNLQSFNDAIKELKQAVTLRTGFSEAHYGMALTYIARGDRGSAQQQERILRPLNADLANNVAAALSGMAPTGFTRVRPREDRRP